MEYSSRINEITVQQEGPSAHILPASDRNVQTLCAHICKSSSHLSLQWNVVVQPLEGTEQRLPGFWNLSWAADGQRAVSRKLKGRKWGWQHPGHCWCGRSGIGNKMTKLESPVWKVNNLRWTSRRNLWKGQKSGAFEDFPELRITKIKNYSTI